MGNSKVFEDSERKFLDAFFNVDDNVRLLIERDKGDWLFNRINSLKYDGSALEDLRTELKSVLQPMEELLVKQPWFNWGGFLKFKIVLNMMKKTARSRLQGLSSGLQTMTSRQMN